MLSHITYYVSKIIAIFAANNVNYSAIKKLRQLPQNAEFYVISYFVKSLMIACPKGCLRCPVLARYHPFLDGTLSLRCATLRYLMSLKYET